LPRERWEWLVGLILPLRPYRCQSCPVRYWSWTPRFFAPVRSAVWLLFAFVAFALLRPATIARTAVSRPERAGDTVGVAPVATAGEEGSAPAAPTLPPARSAAGAAGPEPGAEPGSSSAAAVAAREQLAARLSAAELELAQAKQVIADSEAARSALAAELAASRQTSDSLAPAVDPPPGSAADEGAVASAVEAWAEAWAAQRLEDYLAAYSATYRPPDSSREAWIALRRERLLNPTKIELALSSMAVVVVTPTRATAQFRQRYAADSYRDEVLKRLTLSREGELWKIVEERVIEP
jgi:hypothetical protein